MLKRPSELLTIANAALEAQAKRQEYERLQKEQYDKLNRDFDVECFNAALNRETCVYFQEEIKNARNLSDFEVEGVLRVNELDRCLFKEKAVREQADANAGEDPSSGRESRREIPTGGLTAVKVSWQNASASYAEAGAMSASKLKWISSVWPSWEKYFYADMVNMGAKGRTLAEYLFEGGEGIGHCAKFVVKIDYVSNSDDDVETMSGRERESWKEIDEQYENMVPYYDEQGFLRGVHPLPLAEILSVRGYAVKAVQGNPFVTPRGEDGGDPHGNDAGVPIVDLSLCSGQNDFLIQVSWDLRSKGIAENDESC